MKRLLEGIGTVCVLSLVGITTAFLVNACTGQNVKDTADGAKTVAPFLPGPTGPLVAIGADRLAEAVAAYMEQHPQKPPEEKLTTKDLILIGGMFVAGATRRKVMEMVGSIVKPFPTKTA